MAGINLVIAGGGGHVGLPLGIVFANHGLDVTLLDIDARRVSEINSGHMPFQEKDAQELLEAVIGRSLRATTDVECLGKASAVITVVGTPVDRHLNPTVYELYASIDKLIDGMQDGSLFVLRSTVYPGVTKLVYDRVCSRGRRIHVAFCPERIAEGNAIQEIGTLPQIVSSFEPEAQRRAAELFRLVAPSIIELQPLEAELAKLFTNSWRYLNFAIANQFFMLAEAYGLDFRRIHDAVTRDYPRMRSFARAGFAAGPCLLKDTLQLSTFANNNFFLGHAAMLINEGLPNFLVEQLRRSCDLSACRVAILGMAFKGDSDDARESLSYKLWHLLELHAGAVLCTDPYVSDSSLVPLEQALAEADIIVLGAPHSVYRELKFAPTKTVVDIWGFWPSAESAAITSRVAAAGVSA